MNEFKKIGEEYEEFTEVQNLQMDWENELDAMGAFPNINDSIQMLSKAPPSSRSKEYLINYIQELASV